MSVALTNLERPVSSRRGTVFSLVDVIPSPSRYIIGDLNAKGRGRFRKRERFSLLSEIYQTGNVRNVRHRKYRNRSRNYHTQSAVTNAHAHAHEIQSRKRSITFALIQSRYARDRAEGRGRTGRTQGRNRASSRKTDFRGNPSHGSRYRSRRSYD